MVLGRMEWHVGRQGEGKWIDDCVDDNRSIAGRFRAGARPRENTWLPLLTVDKKTAKKHTIIARPRLVNGLLNPEGWRVMRVEMGVL